MRTVKQVKDPQQGPEVQRGGLSQTVQITAGEYYQRSRFHRFCWGNKYRQEWVTPVEAPLFNLTSEGYSIVKQGGGRQTINLRLQDDRGREYVLRSIDKDPAVNLSPFFQKVVLGAVVKDQHSSAHPYAPLTLQPMADALGVYHTNPELRYIPYDTTLGAYASTFAGMLALLEHRPNDDQTAFDFMGASENVVSTQKMLTDLLTDNDAQVNTHHYLRSRLFDMLLGDWSRHEDNWRWASYTQEKGMHYQAVARDRDHVYYHLDGAIPRFLRFFGMKSHFRSFDAEFDDIILLNKSAAKLDELLLASLSREAWQAVADSVRQELTDAAIEAGVRRLPPAVYAIRGQWLEQSLKTRRDALPKEVMKYYEHLARKPMIYGTDKHEKFVVTARGDALQIEVWKIKKEGKEQQQLYSRTFSPKETKEISLLGLAGNDQFEFRGEGSSTIRLKVYGCAGEDSYRQENPGFPAHVQIYDLGKGSTFDLKKGIKVKTLKRPKVEHFDANGKLLYFYIWD